MTAFYLGTGPQDVGNALSFLGVPGGLTWNNFFYENMDDVNKLIMDECQAIINEGLWNEIRATIKSKLGSKYPMEEMEQLITNFKTNTGFIPEEIKQLGIIVSYDMGWQKRSTGRIYDSLSGHGYMIGCLSGKVVSFGVRSKKCVKCTRATNKNMVVKPHFCTINHHGSSGSMEAALALGLVNATHK